MTPWNPSPKTLSTRKFTQQPTALRSPHGDEEVLRIPRIQGNVHSTIMTNTPDVLAGDEPVLLVHGGTLAARQLLMRQLNSLGIAFRLVDIPSRISMHSSPADHDPIEFLQDFSVRMRSITPKERAVLESVLTGQTNKSISVQLNLTERAIELRKASLMKKLSARSHTELVRRITRYETLKQHLFRHVEVAPGQFPAR